MAAALECWSGRPSTDDDASEQVLMGSHLPSSASHSPSSGEIPPPLQHPASAPAPAKWRRIGRNFAGALAAFKNTLTLESPRDPSPRSPTPARGGAGQLPEKLVADLRRHFDALPVSYAQAGFDMKDILLHARLVEQAAADDQPAVSIEEMHDSGKGGGVAGISNGVAFKLTFASVSPLSWQAMWGSLDSSSMSCKKVQIFEKKGLTLGVVTVVTQPSSDALCKSRVDAALRSSLRRPQPQLRKNGGVKLPFGLCGCEEDSGNTEEEMRLDGGDELRAQRTQQLPVPLPESSVVVSVDEWQTVRSGGEEIGRWLVNADEVQFVDWVGSSSFRALYRGKKVFVRKLRGCEMGSAYDVELRRDLLRLMSCGHRNVLHFICVCFLESHGLCTVTRLMEGGSVHDIMQRRKGMPIGDVLRIATDVAEGLMFMNSHGVAYRDLNTQRILLDRSGNACLGDMGAITPCGNAGEATEYETAGYRWLAPEIIAGDPESVSETWMSNVYSFGMVVWEMLTGEEAYSSYSPVQAAVGIAACGLRPEMPRDCPPLLRSLMDKCWDSCPSRRPQLADIIAALQRLQTAC